MLKFLLLFSILTNTIHCSCPAGFDMIKDGECRGNYTRVDTFYDEATAKAISLCKEIQGLPIIIHDYEAQSYWTARVNAYSIMGLVCNLTTKMWEWSDGSALDYKPPTYSEGLDKACTATGMSWSIDHSGKWGVQYTAPSHIKWTADIFCSAQNVLPVPADDGCGSLEAGSGDGVCYQVGASAETWQDARHICKSFGGDVASIHSLKENSFIRRLAVSKNTVNGIFLGAAISGKGNDFTWSDGSDWDYENFTPGFPVNGLGDCVVMDPQLASGQWVNADCSTKFSFACKLMNFSIPDYCTAGPWKEGQIIFSPGFSYNAATPCDFILTVDAGKKVQVEILLLEANSCCDQLVIFDSYIGGNIIATLTGGVLDKTYTSPSNFMRVAWRPNGGVNVRGLMMSYRGV